MREHRSPVQLVDDLGARHRAKRALRALMHLGEAATPAVRAGLRHENPEVRIGCCKVLDHHMDEAAVPELIENLAHDHEAVRAWAIHALACDRCKEGACRPGEDDVLPIAIRMLLEDESRRVRGMAAGMVGPSVHRSPQALDAIRRTAENDPHPGVRKVARWYVPGGPIYERLRPKPERRPRYPR